MKVILPFLVIAILLWELFAKSPDAYLHTVVCDVGQGDAILLSIGYTQILVDTGPDESVLNCLDKHLPFWDRKIEVLILTHFDDDHIGGFATLASAYTFAYVFLPMTDYKESTTFLEMQKRLLAMQETGTVIKEPFLGQQIASPKFPLENQAKYNSISEESSLELTFLTPFALDTAEYQNLEAQGLFLWQKPEGHISSQSWQNLAKQMSTNDRSIALFITYGEIKFLLLGDLETAGELALLTQGLITRVDVHKVGHHGSKTSSFIELMRQIRPEISLISCGLNNQFGHPNANTLVNLESVGAQVWRTDQMGAIEIVSDGSRLWRRD